MENNEFSNTIPELSHNLDIVLNKNGVYTMDEMSKLQKDDGKFLRNIYSPDDIDFNKLPNFKPPSQDENLLKFAKQSKCKYVMSTSAISSVLSHCFFIFSDFKDPDFDNISEYYKNEPKKYMISQRKPSIVYLRKIDDNIHAFDADQGIFKWSNTTLMKMGHIIEKQLTLTPEKFRKTLLK